MKKITFLFACTVLGLSAQNNVRKLSLDQCVDYALANNEHIKTATYDLEYQKQLKKAGSEIPKAALEFTQGQFNSKYAHDNSITIKQQIPFPAVFAANKNLAKAHIKGSEYKMAATKADLVYQVKMTYYQLVYHYSLENLLLQEDSIYQAFAKQQQEKFSGGSGSLLEKTTSETKVMEIKNMILENEEDMNADLIKLQALLNSETEVEPIWEDLTQKPLALKADSSNLSSHPYLLYLHQQIIAGRKTKMAELYKIFPDLTVGYFNLSIYGMADIGTGSYFLSSRDRLQGFIIGLSIPLWIRPLAAKVNAAGIKAQMAESEYNYNKDLFEGELKQAFALYQKYQNSLAYYKNNALSNSSAILKEAQRSYDSKEITYIEYLSVVSNALRIRSRYLDVINQNNLAVLKLEYLTKH